MVFVTSDTHGDMERIMDKQLKKLKIGDTLIVLGDFGFVWNNDKQEEKNLKKIASMPFRTLFIDGLNENFSALSKYEDTVYMGAQAKRIYKDKIFYIKRGQVLDMEGKKFLCFGGGEGFEPDLIFEQSPTPSVEEFNTCFENLKQCDNNVDYILTHMPSGKISRFINLNSNHTSMFLDFLDDISDKVTYKRWYFGFYHTDKYISPKALAVYQNIIQIAD